MALHVMSIDEKVEAIERVIVMARENGVRSSHPDFFDTLKAIAADLRARQELPRNNALGELERAIARMKNSKTDLGYDERLMVAVANVVINKWSTIQQALENFGEESAE